MSPSKESQRAAYVDVGGMQFLSVDESACISFALDAASTGAGAHILTVNTDILRRYRYDSGYAALLGKDYVAVADGMPIVWASRLNGTPLPTRVTGSSLLVSLSRSALVEGRSILLLGGAPGAGERAADFLRSHAGDKGQIHTLPLPMPFDFSEALLASLGQAVQRAAADVVFVSLSSPKQERLISALRCSAPSACWIGVGAGFDFLAGTVRRAPISVQKIGLEWLYRLAQEPGRLWRRYLAHDLPFALLLLFEAARGRLGSTQRSPS